MCTRTDSIYNTATTDISTNATEWHIATIAGTEGTITLNDQGAVTRLSGLSISGDSKTKSFSSQEIYHPRLYFKYVKSKLTKMQQDKLKDRLGKLKKLIVQAKELKQQALFEELAKRISFIIRESEASACGIEYKIERQYIDKIRHKVKGMRIEFDKFENFPRTVPANIVKKIKKIQKTNVFDEYWILYTTPYGEEKLKTNKEKIKEKDPMLFGRFNASPDIFYFVVDWIDDYCDLTLDKFLDTLKKDDPAYELDKIPEMNDKLIRQIIDEVKEKDKRLKSAKRATYRGLMDDEDKQNTKLGKMIGKLKRKKK